MRPSRSEGKGPRRASALGDRKDHLWIRPSDPALSRWWKCCLCGAMTRERPPSPTPAGWDGIERYDQLTPEERAQYPFTAGG